MDLRTIKVFLAVASGAFFGGLVGLSIHTYMWWIGILVGGFLGYMLYEVERIPSALKQAYNAIINWQPDWQYWKDVAVILSFVGLYTTAGFTGTYSLTLKHEEIETILEFFGLSQSLIGIETIPFGLRLMLLAGLLSFMFSVIIIFVLNSNNSASSRRDLLHTFVVIAVVANPVGLFLVGLALVTGVLAAMVLGVIYHKKIWNKIADIALLGWNFLTYFYRLIHSEVRLLCMIDAALGAGFITFYGNLWLGALFAGFFGVLNLEIIGKKILQCVPARK